MAKNKGEWSELIVFLKLLLTWRINRADTHLKVIEGSEISFRSVVRNVDGSHYYYSQTSKGVRIDSEKKTALGFASYKTIQGCLDEINRAFRDQRAGDGAFEVTGISDCLKQLFIQNSVTQSSIFKHDIKLDVFDPITSEYFQKGFSWK